MNRAISFIVYVAALLEEVKTAQERGRFGHPDLYGRPGERAAFPRQRLASPERLVSALKLGQGAN